MITYTIEAILAIILVIVLMQLFKKKPKPLPAPTGPPVDLANLRITDARTGDVLSIAGVGDAMNDLVAILEARAASYGRAHARLDTSGRDVAQCVDELTLLAAKLFAQP